MTNFNLNTQHMLHKHLSVRFYLTFNTKSVFDVKKIFFNFWRFYIYIYISIYIYIYIYLSLCLFVCLSVIYRLEDGQELEAEILHRSRQFPNKKHRLHAAARSFKKFFSKILIFRRFQAKFRQKKVQNPLTRSEICHFDSIKSFVL